MGQRLLGFFCSEKYVSKHLQSKKLFGGFFLLGPIRSHFVELGVNLSKFSGVDTCWVGCQALGFRGVSRILSYKGAKELTPISRRPHHGRQVNTYTGQMRWGIGNYSDKYSFYSVLHNMCIHMFMQEHIYIYMWHIYIPKPWFAKIVATPPNLHWNWCVF